jgi:hypothetical protein
MTSGAPAPPQYSDPPTLADASIALAGQRERRKSGVSSTIATSGLGVTSSAPLAAKNLLGQ